MLNIRIEEEMKTQLEQYCEANNITVSELIRNLIVEELERGHKISRSFERIEGHTDVAEQRPTLDRRFPALAEMILACLEQEITTQQFVIALASGMIGEKYAGRLMSDEAKNAMDILAKVLKQNTEDIEKTRRVREAIEKALAEEAQKK